MAEDVEILEPLANAYLFPEDFAVIAEVTGTVNTVTTQLFGTNNGPIENMTLDAGEWKCTYPGGLMELGTYTLTVKAFDAIPTLLGSSSLNVTIADDDSAPP